MLVLVVLSNKKSDLLNTNFCQRGRFVEDQVSNRGSSWKHGRISLRERCHPLVLASYQQFRQLIVNQVSE
jgi:hypothetical protein